MMKESDWEDRVKQALYQTEAQKKGSSTICDRTAQKKQKNRKTELKKTGIAPIV